VNLPGWANSLLSSAQSVVPVSDGRAQDWWALPVSDDHELPTREDRIEMFCPDCAARECDSD